MDNLPPPEATRRLGVSTHLIRLSDGRLWGFALPTIRLVPLVVRQVDTLGRPYEKITLGTSYGYPIEIDRLWDTAKRAMEQGPTERRLETFFALAAALLRRAHEIDLAVAATLLAVSIDDLPRIVAAVINVVLGQDCPEEPGENRNIPHV
jgi:hypothetical protein